MEARGRAISLLLLLVVATAASEGGEVVAAAQAFSSGRAAGEEKVIRRLLEGYVRAIEGKDIEQFRAVKPSLSSDEERKARKAFESLQSQAIAMTIQSVEVQEGQALVRVNRRDIINGSIVSSFPQTFVLVTKGRDEWSIREIGR
jgi:hypothetical protein